MEISNLAGPVSPDMCPRIGCNFGGAEVLGEASDVRRFVGIPLVKDFLRARDHRNILVLISFNCSYSTTQHTLV